MRKLSAHFVHNMLHLTFKESGNADQLILCFTLNACKCGLRYIYMYMYIYIYIYVCVCVCVCSKW